MLTGTDATHLICGISPRSCAHALVCLNGTCAHVDWLEGNLADNAMSSSVDPTVAKVCAAAQHTPPLSPTRAMASPSTGNSTGLTAARTSKRRPHTPLLCSPQGPNGALRRTPHVSHQQGHTETSPQGPFPDVRDFPRRPQIAHRCVRLSHSGHFCG